MINGIKHLFGESVRPDQYRIRRHDDGQVHVDYLDPALGLPPTPAELAAADVAYVPPSYLDGGTREPTSAELQSNLPVAFNYYFWRVQEKTSAEAAQKNYVNVTRDSDTGLFVRQGNTEKAAKYGILNGRRYSQRSRDFTGWEADVFEYVEDQWNLIDPNGDFSGGGIIPPDWPTLEAQIDTLFPVPTS